MADASDSQAELSELVSAEAQPTRRVVAPGLEEALFEPVPVLDHGFVRVVDYLGDDGAVVQAARVSYGRGTRKVSEDRGLIRYLMRHWHTTPFEMCEIKFHIKLPIFVARQWIRHRTASVNEYSARYSILDKEVYIPAPEHMAAQASTNRQGRGETLSLEQAAEVRGLLRADAARCYASYQHMLNIDDDGNPVDEGRDGLARELARMNLTLNTYTQWYWKIDLHNLFHFIRLRIDPHAQYEIRAFADVMADLTRRWVPHCYEAFVDYRLEAAQISGPGLKVVRRMLDGEIVTRDQTDLSAREWRELMATLGREVT